MEPQTGSNSNPPQPAFYLNSLQLQTMNVLQENSNNLSHKQQVYINSIDVFY